LPLNQLLEGKQARVDQELKGREVGKIYLPFIDLRLADFVGINKNINDQALLVDLWRCIRDLPKAISIIFNTVVYDT